MVHPPGIFFRSGNFKARLLEPHETELLREAAAINNDVWGEGLHSSPGEFVERAENGFVIAAFDNESGSLQGTMSSLTADEYDLDAIGRDENCAWKTWAGATGNGTFRTSVKGGDCLLCVAVTSKTRAAGGIRENDSVFIGDEPREKIAAILNSKSFLRDPEHRSLIDHLSGRLIEDYIALDLDYVLRFHSKEHAGFPGASIWKAIPNGRVADADSLGWNVLMRYPEVDSKNPVPEEIGSIISCGDALVLAASRLCFLRGIRFAAPYSRPAGFRKTLLDAVSRKGGSNAAAGNFAEFQEKVREVLSEIRR